MINYLMTIENKSSILRGLDNAGKTTIVKKFNGEDINTISPTLGFSIKTLEHNGYLVSAFFPKQIFILKIILFFMVVVI